MASFDTILTELHGIRVSTVDEEASKIITITPQRTFNVPQDYNTILGYAGDVNSQIITFTLPEKHEGHTLYKCKHRKIKWKNTSSGAEGISNLIEGVINSPEANWTALWEVPPAAMTHAGTLEIAISIYDNSDSTVAFSWNTAVYKGFSIGETFSEVGTLLDKDVLPAKNEILIIDIDTRQILRPNGYNTVVCNFGEIGVSNLYFQINKYVHNIDLLGEDTKIYVSFSFQEESVADYRIEKNNIKPLFYSAEDKSNEKVLIKWPIPEEITNNEFYYTGNFTIAIKIIQGTNETEKRWITSTFNQLSIGPSQLQRDVISIISRDETVLQKAIEDYLSNFEFVFDAN